MGAEKYQFESRLTNGQAWSGWLYLPLHIFVIPILAGIYAQFSTYEIDEATINIVYYSIGVLFLAAFMRGYLRDQFDMLLDNLRRCATSLAIAFGMNYALAMVVVMALAFVLSGDFANPNQDAIGTLVDTNFRSTAAIVIIIAPFLEETLFRGVLFGRMYKRGRILAYTVSALVFGIYHVWQYVAIYGDFSMLIYTLQYIPIGIALAYAYEKSGSIFTSISLHALNNALAFYLLHALGDRLGAMM